MDASGGTRYTRERIQAMRKRAFALVSRNIFGPLDMTTEMKLCRYCDAALIAPTQEEFDAAEMALRQYIREVRDSSDPLRGRETKEI